jgi:Tfp pilus assembly protein PilE
MVAILAAIALPSYSSYIKKSRAKGAASDLVALSLVMENLFQKTLVYPDYTDQIIPASDRTGLTNFAAWFASQSSYFVYSVTSTSSGYTLKASPKSTTVVNCTVTLTSSNTRIASGGDCGFTSW